MLLGKRPRPPMKRTTSLSEITFDVSPTDEDIVMTMAHSHSQPSDRYPQGLDQRYSAAPSPRAPHRRSSADFAAEASHFLRSCGLCKRRLVPSRDIYMYRGDTAFCSLECRQQQMSQDERLEKCSLASKKEATASSGAGAAAATGETVAAM